MARYQSVYDVIFSFPAWYNHQGVGYRRKAGVKNCSNPLLYLRVYTLDANRSKVTFTTKYDEITTGITMITITK